MIENVIFTSLDLKESTQKDLKYIFKGLQKLNNSVLLAILIYVDYLLMKRGVING